MTWISNNPWLAWLGLALILAAIETITVDFTFLMVAGGALAGSIASAAGLSFPTQVVMAVLVSGVLLLLVRPIVRNKFAANGVSTDIGAAGLVGRTARVIEPVNEEDGRVKLAGETWSARVGSGGTRIEPGTDVVVVAIRGATAIVSPRTSVRRAESDDSIGR